LLVFFYLNLVVLVVPCSVCVCFFYINLVVLVVPCNVFLCFYIEFNCFSCSL
jgi:hypothetical protein